MKKVLTILFAILFLISSSSCSLLKKPLDNKTGLSNSLKLLETNIRDELWDNAFINLEESQKNWKKLKPFLQIDMDHDYINNIEDYFTQLKGYIETKEKPLSLSTVLLLKETWDNIGSL